MTGVALLFDDEPRGSSARNLFVTGTTTINRTGGYPTGFDVTSGANFRLGTLSNLSNGALSNCYLSVFDNDGTASDLPTRIQFRGANVITNHAFVFLEGADAAIVDQDTGQNAFRNLTANTNQFYVGSAVVMSFPGSFSNTGDVYVYDDLATQTGSLTVNGTVTNSGADGYFYVSEGGRLQVTGDFNNSGDDFDGGLFITGNHNDPTVSTTVTIDGNLHNAVDSGVYLDGRRSPARLVVKGNLTNTGGLYLRGIGSVEVNGVITMSSGEVFMQDSPSGFETFRMTAQRIDLAAGTRFGARGTLFCDLVDSGIFSPGASPGRVTVNGNITMTDSATLEIEIGGTTAGTQYDQVVQVKAGGTGTILDGILAISLVEGFHSTIQNSDSFAVLTSDRPLAGQFNNVASGGRISTVDGTGSFQVNYSGNNVTLTAFQVAAPPTITSIPVDGVTNTSITVFGTGLVGTVDVKFNGASTFSFEVKSDTELLAYLPNGFTSGPITVVTNHGTAVSAASFTILPDSDNDGMSDAYEQQHFGSPTGGDPVLDTDGDGESNAEEFIAGTNPKNSTSRFAITAVRRQGNDIVVAFSSAQNKRYRLRGSDTLADGFPLNIANLAGTEANPAREVTDVGGALQPQRFYRVEVVP